MQANRRRDTAPEMAVRSALHRMGVRYRVDVPLAFDRRRRADIVFTKVKVAVFIDGCFWHACPEHFKQPKSNVEYWGPKIARNVARDHETTQLLEDSGWHVLRFWEHEESEAVARSIVSVVRAARD